MPSKKTDMLGMEDLAHEIKENLRLKTQSSYNSNRLTRQSPYQIPNRSSLNGQFPHSSSSSKDFIDSTESRLNTAHPSSLLCHSRNLNIKSKVEKEIDDPYELLQALIKSKNLVKEAVRRLQINNITTEKTYFEDSDDEISNSPLLHMYQ